MKLLVDEPGADEAWTIWSRARLMVSTRLLYAESRAALAAAVRAGRVAPGDPSLLREKLEALARDIAYVEVSPPLVARAGDLADEHGLRGYDAVHLSSALEIDVTDTVLATGDGPLAGAAQTLGLAVARLPAQSSEG